MGNGHREGGTGPLDEAEVLRVQRIAIGDDRFVKLGVRTDAGFVGDHDRETQRPIPDHISARHEDIASLVRGHQSRSIMHYDHDDEALVAPATPTHFIETRNSTHLRKNLNRT
ncbi:hypothetical protein ABIB94_008043 [Bradyrhizobium sp. JR7.2]